MDDSEVVTAEIHIKDHHFVPSYIEVPTGKKLKLTVYNDDDTIEEFESVDLKREKIILAHSSALVIIAPLQAGKYSFFGEFNPDTAQGYLIAK